MIDKLDSLDVGEKVLEGKAAWKYAEDILQLVSRTFALNIQVLRGKLHRSILLAYLYLRIADTVEDDPDMNVFKTGELETEKIRTFVAALPESWHGSEDPNKDLCSKSEVVVPLLKSLPKNYQKPVCNVVIEMCGGMAKFALRQEAALSSGWFTLESVADLDEYCYYVAGIVGKLLTNLFAADTCLIGNARKAEMQKLDVSFGLALQVANIVKDCVEDCRFRCSPCRSDEGACRKGVDAPGRCDCLYQACAEREDAYAPVLPVAALYGGREHETHRRWFEPFCKRQEGEDLARYGEENREVDDEAFLFGQVD